MWSRPFNPSQHFILAPIARSLREVNAYEALHPELVKQFLGQFVAIYQGELVDHDADEDALMKRRQRDYAGKVVLVRRVEIEASRELVTEISQ